MRHALWFSALFTITCVLLAFVGPEEDAAITGQLAMVGAVLFAANPTREQAILREKRIKKWNRAWKLDLIEASNPEWHDLAEDLGFEPIA